MAAKFFVVLSLAVAASAVPLAPLAKVVYAEPEAPAYYDFEYSVHDDHTGDVKQQKESRAGDAVHGSYSLVQPDGVQRIVEYTSDKEHGFNAIVRYEGQPHPAPVAKLAYAAPVAKVAYAPAPVHYAAPVAKVAYAAPVAKVAYAAPVAKVAYAPAPIQYAAPVAKVAYAAPVAKVAYAAPVAKVAYAAPLAQVTFSSPAVSYHH
ncbi:cuticle protein 8-like [Plodia interpunctella]|uniref:cuticle protein 8-like n=1 Tax=Plodia interpunctella TaxID=58824 RepID=UPI002368E792|nr:cuticle protein 8-like [Plodia interpunctella]